QGEGSGVRVKRAESQRTYSTLFYGTKFPFGSTIRAKLDAFVHHAATFRLQVDLSHTMITVVPFGVHHMTVLEESGSIIKLLRAKDHLMLSRIGWSTYDSLLDQC